MLSSRTKWSYRNRRLRPRSAAQIGSCWQKSMSEQGYSLVSIHRQVFLAACFSRWLKQKGIILVRQPSAPIIPAPVFAISRSACRDLARVRCLLLCLSRHLSSTSCACNGSDSCGEKKISCRPLLRLSPVAPPGIRAVSVLEQRCVGPQATIINYVPVRSAVSSNTVLGLDESNSRVLCASDVVRFVQRQAPRWHMKRAKLMTNCTLVPSPNYGRYLRESLLDLLRRRSDRRQLVDDRSIPRAISPEHVLQSWRASINAPRSGAEHVLR